MEEGSRHRLDTRRNTGHTAEGTADTAECTAQVPTGCRSARRCGRRVAPVHGSSGRDLGVLGWPRYVIVSGVEVDETRLAAVCEQYGIGALMIFCSVARGGRTLRRVRTSGRSGIPGWAARADAGGRAGGGAAFLCGLSMRRDALLLEEVIEAADRAVALVQGVGVAGLAGDRMRRDALSRPVVELRRARRGCDLAVG